MMKKFFIIASVILTGFAFSTMSCDSKKDSDSSHRSERLRSRKLDKSHSKEYDDRYKVKEEKTEKEIKQIVNIWSESLNQRNPEMAKNIYAPNVFFYTMELPAEDCLKRRQDLVVKNPSFHQSIISDIEISDNEDGTKAAYFTKETHQEGREPHIYRCYFIFQKIGGEWKIIKESDETTDRNVAKRTAITNIPKNAIRGDFDGDGKIDHVWVEAKYDSEGYATTPIVLKSDNPNLSGLTWPKGMMGVVLENLGDLDNSNRDFLGAIPYSISNWCVFETYGYKGGKLKPVLDSFTIYDDEENYKRVFPADRPGYVYINYNDMGDVEDFTTKQKMVKLK